MLSACLCRGTTEGNKGEHRQTRYRRNSGCIARDSACLSGITIVYIRSYVFQQIASVDLRIGERVCEHSNGRAKRRWKTCAHVIFPRQLATFNVKTIFFFLAHARQSHSLFYLERIERKFKALVGRKDNFNREITQRPYKSVKTKT